ncbi:MAG TPA: LppX_LprAFG lipoprotein [Thermomicrobiales bacterium]|nr:LppX_LprAFG lipoprotein [Thermomicrobiales bacterium]
MRNRSVVKLMTVLIVLMTIVTACGGGNDTGKLNDDADVAEVLKNASERLAATDSMRFDMTVKGTTLIDSRGTMHLLSAKGVMARPDKVDVEFQIRVLGAQTISIRMITIGDQSWTTDIVTGKWIDAPEEFGYNPAVLYDNQNGLGPVMGKINDARIAETGSIDGRDAYHVTGTASQGVMRPLTSGTMKGDPIVLDLWIDGETWDLLRVVVTEPENSGSDDPATWTMNLSDFNQKVDIEPPV